MVLETQSYFCEEYLREELIKRRIFEREATGIDIEKWNCKRVRNIQETREKVSQRE